jgi:hypothetical protein
MMALEREWIEPTRIWTADSTRVNRAIRERATRLAMKSNSLTPILVHRWFQDRSGVRHQTSGCANVDGFEESR